MADVKRAPPFACFSKQLGARGRNLKDGLDVTELAGEITHGFGKHDAIPTPSFGVG
jgi:hypothetical protein